MEEPLRRALESVRESHYAEAIEALIGAWRDRRSPAIADLVELVDARLPERPFASLLRPRVADTIAGLAAVREADDPRLGTFVVACLGDPPFVGGSSRRFWELLLEIAGRLRDPRIARAAKGAAARFRARISPAPLRDDLLEGLRELEKVEPPREPTPKEAAVEAELAAQFATTKARARTADELLAAVYADPLADAPRLVYADHLHEQGDPRGELISLQFKRRDQGLTDREAAREKALLKQHLREWLGGLASVVSATESYSRTTFERGFLAIADLYLNAAKKLPLTWRDPAWSTVEEVRGAHAPTVVDNVRLPSLRRLGAGIGGHDLDSIERIGRRGPYANVEELEIWCDVREDSVRKRLADLRGYPALKRLAVGFTPDATVVEQIGRLVEICANRKIRRLEILRPIDGEAQPQNPSFDPVLAAVAALPAVIDELAILPPWTRVRRLVELKRDGIHWIRQSTPAPE